jgi:hypothetical protein
MIQLISKVCARLANLNNIAMIKNNQKVTEYNLGLFVVLILY